MLRVNPVNRQELLKRLTFHPKSLVFKTVSVPPTTRHSDGNSWSSKTIVEIISLSH